MRINESLMYLCTIRMKKTRDSYIKFEKAKINTSIQQQLRLFNMTFNVPICTYYKHLFSLVHIKFCKCVFDDLKKRSCVGNTFQDFSGNSINLSSFRTKTDSRSRSWWLVSITNHLCVGSEIRIRCTKHVQYVPLCLS